MTFYKAYAHYSNFVKGQWKIKDNYNTELKNVKSIKLISLLFNFVLRGKKRNVRAQQR